MDVGAFSVSLSVKDLKASKAFYEKLGFSECSGVEDDGWLVMSNGDHKIGLFQDMFEGNILTFSPGWDQNKNALESYTDIRELQRELRGKGVEFTSEVDESTTGPGSFTLVDPDGNAILFDQYT